MDRSIVCIFVFAMGSILGSFLNVCIYRLPKGESVVSPPSHCPKCKKNIAWYDNIPLLSFILLLGRCRFCKERIAWRYFLVELITAGISVLLFAYFGLTIKFFAYALLACGLIVATFVDFEIQEIPDEISLGGIVAGLVIAAIFPSVFDSSSRVISLSNSLLGLVAGGGSIYLMGLFGKLIFRKEAMGGGDVKLMAMVGVFLGWKLAMVVFFMAPFFGAVVGIITKIRSGSNIIPYGPYLSLATLVAIFYGEDILRFFLYGFYL